MRHPPWQNLSGRLSQIHRATAARGSGASITLRLMSTLLCRRDAARSILRQYSRQAAAIPTTSRASNRSFAICRHHDATLRSKKDSIRLHIRSLEETRRKITSTAALRHGHIDPPKPGEELHVTFIDKDGDTHEFEVAEGDNLLDIAQANDLEMEGKIHCVKCITGLTQRQVRAEAPAHVRLAMLLYRTRICMIGYQRQMTTRFVPVEKCWRSLTVAERYVRSSIRSHRDISAGVSNQDEQGH
jgi:hypothetical protein